MTVFWKKIEFHKGSDCKAIGFAACGLEKRPGGLSVGKVSKLFHFNVFQGIKRLTMALKKQY